MASDDPRRSDPMVSDPMVSDPMVSDPMVAEPERLLPRISILSLIGLLTLCAVFFWAIRTGFQGDFIALKSLVVIICLVIACFLSYVMLFLVSYLFSLVLRPLLELSGASLERQYAALPTESLPDTPPMDVAAARELNPTSNTLDQETPDA